jgi:hypothetical protein
MSPEGGLKRPQQPSQLLDVAFICPLISCNGEQSHWCDQEGGVVEVKLVHREIRNVSHSAVTLWAPHLLTERLGLESHSLYQYQELQEKVHCT